MKIATFGCSWTHGLLEVDDGYGWPWALAERHPDWEIENFALAGSSLSFQVLLLDDLLKNGHEYDRIVFQITAPMRVTYFDDEYDYGKYLYRPIPNYRKFDLTGDIYHKFVCITSGHLALDRKHSFWRHPYKKYDFAQTYYTYVNKNINRVEYRALVNYVKDRVDFLYFHHEDVCGIGGIPVAMEELGTQYVADDGGHFNREGCKVLSEWIESHI